MIRNFGSFYRRQLEHLNQFKELVNGGKNIREKMVLVWLSNIVTF